MATTSKAVRLSAAERECIDALFTAGDVAVEAARAERRSQSAQAVAAGIFYQRVLLGKASADKIAAGAKARLDALDAETRDEIKATEIIYTSGASITSLAHVGKILSLPGDLRDGVTTKKIKSWCDTIGVKTTVADGGGWPIVNELLKSATDKAEACDMLTTKIRALKIAEEKRNAASALADAKAIIDGVKGEPSDDDAPAGDDAPAPLDTVAMARQAYAAIAAVLAAGVDDDTLVVLRKIVEDLNGVLTAA